jgi:hypothetical protein
MCQEHANAITVLMNNSQLINLMNGCISDLSSAAMEILREAKVPICHASVSCILCCPMCKWIFNFFSTYTIKFP